MSSLARHCRSLLALVAGMLFSTVLMTGQSNVAVAFAEEELGAVGVTDEAVISSASADDSVAGNDGATGDLTLVDEPGAVVDDGADDLFGGVAGAAEVASAVDPSSEDEGVEPADWVDQAADASTSRAPKVMAHSTKDGLTSSKSDLPEGVYTIVADSNKHAVLDVSGASTASGANVQVYEQNGTDAQHWKLTYNKDVSSIFNGMVQLVNVASGKALGVITPSAKSGANVSQYDVNHEAAQWWKLEKVSASTAGGEYLLRSALNNGLVLDVNGGRMGNGTNVQVWSSNGSAAQAFSFLSVADERKDPWLTSGVALLARDHVSDLSDGTYVISSSGAIRSVLDVSNGSKDSGGNVQVWSSNNSGAQRWVVSTTVAADGTPWRTILNVNSGKALDVRNGGTSNGANVWQYTSNGSLAQSWAIVANGDGTLTLRSALGHNLVLDLWGGGTASGTNADVYASNDTGAQKFVFTSTAKKALVGGDNVADGLYVITSPDGKAIDVPSASTANGQQLQAYVSNGSQAQVFAITYDAKSGYYNISNVNSIASIDLDSGDPLPGGKVQQWAYGSTNVNQKWIIRDAGDGGYRIVSPATGLSLSIVNGKLSTSDDVNATVWHFTRYVIPTGMYQIANTGNNKVMDVTSASWASGARIQTYASNGSMAQKWYVRSVDEAGDSYSIQSINSGMYLSPSGSSVVQLGFEKAGSWKVGFLPGQGLTLTSVSNGLRVYSDPLLSLRAKSTASNQGWKLASTILEFSGEYELVPYSNTGMRLDVVSGSRDNGANIQLYTSNDSKAQRWAISDDGDGWFAILSRNSGKSMDVQNGSTANGANVWQYEGNYSTAQKWIFEMGDYGITIRSKLGTVLGVLKPSSNGSNVTTQNGVPSDAQGWLLKPAASVPSYIVAVDPGHGGNDSGAVGNGLKESTLNWSISVALRERLVANGVEVYFTKAQNESVSVRDRVVRAKNSGARVLVSVHINSGDSSAQGAMILTPGTSSYNYHLHTEGRQLGSYILQNISALGIRNEGYLERYYPQDGSGQSHYANGSVADYYGIVRYSRQVNLLGIIIEHGFISNSHDAALLSRDSFLRSLGYADADAILRMYGTGGGSSLTSSGSTDLSGTVYANNANGSASGPTNSSEVSVNTTIMGTSATDASQIARYFKSRGVSYPSSVYSSKGAPTIEDFACIVMEESAAEGVRAEVVFCQAMHETGWLQFGGLVESWKCNFAGLGATGASNDVSTDYGRGYAFSDVRQGIRAQVQHLKAYASTAALNNECVDQRFKYVTRGSAPTIGGLNGKWAVPGNGYGESIVALAKRLLAS